MQQIRLLGAVLLVLCSYAQLTQAAPARPRPERAQPPGKMAFLREGKLWVWEAGRERQVTTDGEISSPRFSPSGRYISFVRNRDLWVAQVDGERQWRVATTAGAGEWAPQDDVLAFSTAAGAHTLAVTASGPRETRLLAAGWSGTAWSPDGQRLAVARNAPGEGPAKGTTAIGLVPRSGGDPGVILETTYPHEAACGPVDGAEQLRWSGDSRWLSFYRSGLYASLSADCGELSVLSADGTQVSPVAVVPANPAWFAWAPRGAVLSFTDGAGRDAWANKSLRVAVMPPTPPFQTLTLPGYADRDPAWSLDGKRLAFTRSLAKAPDLMTLPAPGQAIWVAEVHRGRAEAVPESENGFSPCWGPGGSLIWFRGVGGEKGSLSYVAQPGQTAERLPLAIDLPFPYYGQWRMDLVFDWWRPAVE